MKNVLVTGAAKRIGAACAEYLHEQGCNVCLHYRASKREVLDLSRKLNSIRPDSAFVIQADLSSLSEIRELTQSVLQKFGRLDVLINNASAFYPTPMGGVSEAEWDELFATNLKAPFFLSQMLYSKLYETKGVIINITDIHADRGLKGYPVYSITKAGLVAMTRVLAKEFGPDVRVNAISPGAILWPENEVSDTEKNEIIDRVALKTSGNSLDIAKAVKFLIQDADYITGQEIAVDGGRTLFC